MSKNMDVANFTTKELRNLIKRCSELLEERERRVEKRKNERDAMVNHGTSDDVEMTEPPNSTKRKENEVSHKPKIRILQIDDKEINKTYEVSVPVQEVTETPTTNKENQTLENNTIEKRKNYERSVYPDETEDENTQPIVIRNHDQWNHISFEFRERKLDYTKAKHTAIGIKITPTTIADYRGMTKYLDATGFKYHTFTLKKDKPLKLCIKGIPPNYTEEDIKEDLKNQGFPINSAKILKDKNEKPLPIFLVEIDRTYKALYNITKVCNLDIKIQSYMSKSSTGQCHRCQIFGHAQSGCRADFKCLKCGEAHPTNTCEKPKTLPAKCANCAGPHPANFRGCPKNPQNIKTNKLQETSKNTLTKTTKPVSITAKAAPTHNTPTPKTTTRQTSTEPKSRDSIAIHIGELMMQFASTKHTEKQYNTFIQTTKSLINAIQVNE